MLKIINADSSTPQIIATEGYLHRKDDPCYAPVSKSFLPSGRSLDDYEELTTLPTASPSDDYDERVNERIRTRYSLSQELAVLRQRDSKPEEYAAYNAFCEACKAAVKAEMSAQEAVTPNTED